MAWLSITVPRTIEVHHGTFSPTWRASNPLWTRPFGYQLASPRLCSVGSPSAVSCSTISEPVSETDGKGGSGMYGSIGICIYHKQIKCDLCHTVWWEIHFGSGYVTSCMTDFLYHTGGSTWIVYLVTYKHKCACISNILQYCAVQCST